ncbi:MAG: hypothetical protein LQ341_007723, partial [Variospora aurantia]
IVTRTGLVGDMAHIVMQLVTQRAKRYLDLAASLNLTFAIPAYLNQDQAQIWHFNPPSVYALGVPSIARLEDAKSTKEDHACKMIDAEEGYVHLPERSDRQS